MPCQDKTTNIFSGWGVLAGRAGTPFFIITRSKKLRVYSFDIQIAMIKN